MNLRRAVFTATTLLTVALSCQNPAAAQENISDDSLKYQLTVYGWFPSIGGTSAFPTSSGSSFNASADSIIDSLQFALMGTFGIKKGAWGLWTDLMWSNLDGSKDATRDFTVGPDAHPGTANANLSLNIKTTIWTLAGTYELGKSRDYTADFLFGARLLDVKQTLDWTLNGDISGVGGAGHRGSSEINSSIWDGIIGVKGVVYLGDERKWFIPYYADIGTGQSDLTWQVDSGIGYQYDWGALTATWRYLDYNMKSGEAIQSMNFNGPMLGATFQW